MLDSQHFTYTLKVLMLRLKLGRHFAKHFTRDRSRLYLNLRTGEGIIISKNAVIEIFAKGKQYENFSSHVLTCLGYKVSSHMSD